MRLDLNGRWYMRKVGEDKWINANVPGSVLNDMLNAGETGDPFFRDNEDCAKEMAKYDYEYKRTFVVDEELLINDKVLLCCDGIDTLARISINEEVIANTHNMHRRYQFDIKKYLITGTNTIHIYLSSPISYITQKYKEVPLWGSGDAIKGYQYLRKAHSMFGWDWGPQIPDAGIWRDVYIKGYKSAKLDDVYITQIHEEKEVTLDIRIKTEKLAVIAGNEESLRLEVKVISPEGKRLTKTQVVGYELTSNFRNIADNVILDSIVQKNNLYQNNIKLVIENPQLWWPNGYGKQPLYQIIVFLKNEDSIVDMKKYNIGLRTITVKREKDQWGESFEFNINGISIFAMGADYIPEDSILARYSPERTKRLIEDCIEANFNCIRVWGGGIYPPDYFFDLCDEYGLIVWQDLMFACSVYVMTDSFAENIILEAQDNIKRIRHHACLGVWCGNNEIETAWADWDFEKTAKLRTDYIKQFEILLPKVAKEVDPNTFYWLSSPSSGGGFDVPNDENRGDVHYWDVWHGLKPFTEYRKFHFRFCSEFGFQSFPGLKTVESFTLPEDRNIFSYVMEKHQKNDAANGKILYYISENFLYPKNFSSLLYVSQILQAEAIKYAVEHWRRNRGRCMGALYWQLNDCWPVASWSSIDSFGRWKALHYYAKRFFAPILISAKEEGANVELYVANETFKTLTGSLRWSLKDNTGKILSTDTLKVQVQGLSSCMCCKLDFSDVLVNNKIMRESYLEFFLIIDGNCISKGTVLFTKPKHFNFIEPELTAEIKEASDRFIISLSAKTFAKSVYLDLKENDCIFSDNYFDLSKNEEKTVEIRKDRISKNLTLEQFKNELKLSSIYDTY